MQRRTAQLPLPPAAQPPTAAPKDASKEGVARARESAQLAGAEFKKGRRSPPLCQHYLLLRILTGEVKKKKKNYVEREKKEKRVKWGEEERRLGSRADRRHLYADKPAVRRAAAQRRISRSPLSPTALANARALSLPVAIAFPALSPLHCSIDGCCLERAHENRTRLAWAGERQAGRQAGTRAMSTALGKKKIKK